MRLFWEIDGGEVQPALNQSEIELELNFDLDDPDSTGSVSLRNYDFGKDVAQIAQKWLDDGKTGGVGIFEGIPMKLTLVDGAKSMVLFDGYLDLSNGEVTFQCDELNAVVQQAGSKEWLEDHGEDSFTFEQLFKEDKTITSSDWIFCPYIISTIPNYREIAILYLTGFVLGTELARTIKDAGDIVPELANPFETPTALVKSILYLAYVATMILAMVKLINDLINAIIQPVKYHAGMRLKTLLEKGSDKLGLEFASTEFSKPLTGGIWKSAVIIPEKFTAPPSPDDVNILGFTRPTPQVQTGYYNGTFGQLLEGVKQLWNSKKILNGTGLRIEKRDFNTSSPKYTLPDVEILEYKTNASELKANLKVAFQTDLQDENTIDEYTGTVSQRITFPKAVNNRKMVLMRGLDERNIPFALGKRKTTLTGPEKFFDGILSVVGGLIDALSSVANTISGGAVPEANLSGLIKNRIGMLKLSTDSFSVPKIVIMDINDNPQQNKVSQSNGAILNSQYILNNYYDIESFTPATDRPNANQWIRYELPSPINVCYEDIENLKEDNIIFTSDGKEAKLESMTVNIESEQTTSVRYRVNECYTKNLRDRIFTPNGL